MNYFELEPEKVWQFASAWTKDKKKEEFEKAVNSGMYLASEKKDGHWHRFVMQNGEAKIQTRGISKVTDTYGEHQDSLPHLFNFLVEKCPNDTILIGEMYIPGKKDRDITSILGCLPSKAIIKQREEKVRFFIFDVLVWDGEPLFKTMFEDRISILHNRVRPTLSENEYIDFAEYYEGEEINSLLEVVLEQGGEGIVMTRKDAYPDPGKRTAKKTIKIKSEVSDDIDAFFTGNFLVGSREYKGDEIRTWEYWQNLKTGEFIKGLYFNEYIAGEPYEPVTKNYFFGRPGSLEVGVYKENGEIFSLGYVSGITDLLKDQFVKNKNDVILKPCLIGAMEFTEDKQLRHPRFKGFNSEMKIEDCTYDKLFRE